MEKIKFIPLFLFLVLMGAQAAEEAKGIQRIIFEDQRIEGKIRRPQLVLIKADERPLFPPMIMQSLGKNANIAGSVDEEIVENSPYRKAFRFDGTRINNYVP